MFLPMAMPETTSAESFARFVGGKCLRVGEGKAWRELKAWIIALPQVVSSLPLPSVSEPFLARTRSGEVEFQEREGKGPWTTRRLKKGLFFLTTGGAPYECRWQTATSEPFESMAVFLELPLLQRALEEGFGAEAANARLRDASAFVVGALNSMMEQLHGELARRKANPLFVQGIAQIGVTYTKEGFNNANAQTRTKFGSLRHRPWLHEHELWLRPGGRQTGNDFADSESRRTWRHIL
jgi:AraC family transcriptional regulator